MRSWEFKGLTLLFAIVSRTLLNILLKVRDLSQSLAVFLRLPLLIIMMLGIFLSFLLKKANKWMMMMPQVEMKTFLFLKRLSHAGVE